MITPADFNRKDGLLDIAAARSDAPNVVYSAGSPMPKQW